MSSQFAHAVAAFLVVSGLAGAQTFSSCDPTAGDTCPPNPAFGGTVEYDFSTVSSVDDLGKFWLVDDGVKYNDKTLRLEPNGGNFVIYEEGNAPTLISKNYIFFGKVEVTMQAAPGQGIISSIVLQSDSRDEIDWEFVGSFQNRAETNFYSKGVNDYTRAGKSYVDFNPMSSIHTYTIDWTPDAITFSIDGAVVRTATTAEADNGKAWPQTPCQIRLGTWIGGGKDSPEGTTQWAGGKVKWEEAPFTAIYKSLKITDYGGGYSGATEYVWEGSSGTQDSIQVKGGVLSPGFSSPVAKEDTTSSNSSSAIPSTTSSASAESSPSSSATILSTTFPRNSTTTAASAVGSGLPASLATTTSSTTGTAATTPIPTGGASGMKGFVSLAMLPLLATLFV